MKDGCTAAQITSNR